MKKYYGNYLGVVVQNNDPCKSGSVKIFVPHVSMHVYKDWFEKNDDLKFKGIGKNIDSDLNIILKPLKDKLPWATCALPLVGSGGSGRYNAFTENASISDTNRLATFSPNASGTKGQKLNNDGIGESPGRKYELTQVRLSDAFTDTTDTSSGSIGTPNRINKYAYHYTPNTYSNKSKGSYSIPNVGAHVWVFFTGGDPMKPVYFAYCTNEEDWKGIYETEDGPGIDYPGAFENIDRDETYPKGTYDESSEVYRGKFVINQKGGVLEIVNTDNKEQLKLTHYSGSFKEFNNHANIELATENDQKLVLGDSFETTKGHWSSFIGKDLDHIVKGNIHRKVGKLDPSLYQDWREIAGEIAEVKQLFEIKRTEYKEDGMLYFKQAPGLRESSARQSKTGTPGACPVCSGPRGPALKSHWAQDEYFAPQTNFIHITPAYAFRQRNTTGGFIAQNTSGVKRSHGSGGHIFNAQCPVCNGSTRSPSTMHGMWVNEPLKSELKFKKFVKDRFKQLIDIEKQLGEGGSEIINIAKHKVETIGLVMNDFGSLRVDPIGKMYRDKVILMPGGVLNSQAPSPLIEYVHVDDLPGGSYTLNVCNRFNVQVGAGGISMKSYGPVDISGTITNITGEQVNMTSQSEVNIDGGKRLTLVADILSIRQRNREQVLVDSSLGVTQNVLIGGGLHVEGELSCNHITAPVEIQQTEPVQLYGRLLRDMKFKVNIEFPIGSRTPGVAVEGTQTSLAGTVTNCLLQVTEDSDHITPDGGIQMYDHFHPFKNVPLSLKDSNEEVRRSVDNINDNERSPAHPPNIGDD